MAVGFVKIWFNKGYGFIIPEDGGKDVFCYYKDIIGQECKPQRLQMGDKVEYELEQAEQGPQAKNVRIIG